MKGTRPSSLKPVAAAATALFLAACGGGYYHDAPPYYYPQYGPPYPLGSYEGQGGPGGAADPSKIENPDWDAGRQHGRNPAQNHAPGSGQAQAPVGPGSGGGSAAPSTPSGPASGILVPNRPGMIMSPYAQDPNKLIDVRGLPSGTVIECPYSEDGRTIRVP